MQSIQPPLHGQWLCKPCHRIFSSWEALMKHKEQKRRDEKGNHIHCKLCGQDFKTQAGELRHLQQEHPQEQSLDCPGCGHGLFKRLAALMHHIESGECVRIDTSVLDELREKKLEFPRQLEQLTQQSVKGNYMKYMPSGQSASPVSGWHVDKVPTPFKHKEEDFPTLSSIASGGARPPEKPVSAVSKAEDDMGSWGEEEPPSPTQKRPLAATASGLWATFESMDPDDPGNPAFNSARYYCSITEKFNCPKRLCGKSFKSAGGLIGHLRSPAHGGQTYRCPYCLKTFKSLTAITSHAESSSVKCRIRDTDNYDSFLDQLTAGIVDVDRTRHDDGTVIYRTSEQAKQRIRGIKVDESVGPTRHKSPEPHLIKW